MKEIKLDVFEMAVLLDACLRGSHLCSGTIRRFVDEWYELFTPKERMQLFEWTIRLTYDRSCIHKEANYKPHFEADSRCCHEDITFVHRYHPDNQYKVTARYAGKEEVYDAFLMNGSYYIDSRNFIFLKYIKEVKHNPYSEWSNYKHDYVDYDRNIIVDLI